MNTSEYEKIMEDILPSPKNKSLNKSYSLEEIELMEDIENNFELPDFLQDMYISLEEKIQDPVKFFNFLDLEFDNPVDKFEYLLKVIG